MIEARCSLTQPSRGQRQFVVTTGSNHHLILDDPQGATGPKPVELVAVALAGCTAFDVINILRKKRQQVTAYEVRVEADQVTTPPQVLTDVRLHHLLTGFAGNPAAVVAAIRRSAANDCAGGALLGKTAHIHADYEILEETGELRGERQPELVGAASNSGWPNNQAE